MMTSKTELGSFKYLLGNDVSHFITIFLSQVNSPVHLLILHYLAVFHSSLKICVFNVFWCVCMHLSIQFRQWYVELIFLATIII